MINSIPYLTIVSYPLIACDELSISSLFSLKL
nr:MAG TPA: hypothetical protein [Caudoviricetes sp.]